MPPRQTEPDTHRQPASTLGLTGWSSIVANLSAVSLVCYLLYHGLTVTFPSIQSGFQNELKSEREMFRTELKALREEASADRRAFDERSQRLVGELSRNTEAIKTLAEEVRKANGKGDSQ